MKTYFYIMLLGFSFTILSCQSGTDINDLAGKWQVTDMQADMPEISPMLIENAKAFALATTYEFNSDMTFEMMIAKTELDNARKHSGKVTINDGRITLLTDHVSIENQHGEWVDVEKGNSGIYQPMYWSVKEKSQNKLVLLEESKMGTVHYTLSRVE